MMGRTYSVSGAVRFQSETTSYKPSQNQTVGSCTGLFLWGLLKGLGVPIPGDLAVPHSACVFLSQPCLLVAQTPSPLLQCSEQHLAALCSSLGLLRAVLALSVAQQTGHVCQQPNKVLAQAVATA